VTGLIPRLIVLHILHTHARFCFIASALCYHCSYLVITLMGLGSFLFSDLAIFFSDLSIFASFVALYLQVKNRKSAAGVSLQTVGAVAAARTIHVLSHPLDLHFMPDTIPFALSVLMDYLNAFTGCFVLWFIIHNHWSTYESEKDNFSQNFLLKIGIDAKLVHKFRYAFIYLLATVFGFVWYVFRRSSLSFFSSYFCCTMKHLERWLFCPNCGCSNKIGWYHLSLQTSLH
jgi:hypothetical protein